MKRNLFALAAVVFALTLSSFTTTRVSTFFLTYKGTGNQFQVANYNILSSASRVSGTGSFNWISVQAEDEFEIDDALVSATVTAENKVAGGSPHILSNETADTPALDVKL
ncbi:hypothetical protein [Chitinophaga caseinilytica]|uniref:Uncharacterized protein n=1 Tax=Chitinophaga caseinilytica TaxID=2267521 RepID=A0ABZ2Z212_9BACT